MTQDPATLRRAGFISYCIAIALGVLLTVITVWSDMEATFYGFDKIADEPLASLSCPPLMTTQDRSQITIRLHNPFDKVIKPRVKAEFSASYTIISEVQQLELQPGEWRTLTWEVSKDNLDLERFIFARVFTYPVSSLKMQEGVCGVIVLNLPFAGGPALFYTLVALAFVGAGLGMWLWARGTHPSASGSLWRMRFLALVVATGVVTGTLGLWLLGVITLVVTVLALSVFLMVHTAE